MVNRKGRESYSHARALDYPVVPLGLVYRHAVLDESFELIFFCESKKKTMLVLRLCLGEVHGPLGLTV